MVKKLFLVVIMAVVLVFVGNSVKAAFNDVTYTVGDDVILYLSTGTINLKVMGGSVASTTVNDDNVVFIMGGGSSVSLTNTDRKLFVSSLGTNTVCSNSDAQVVLTATSTALNSITVSIGADCPAINTGSGTPSGGSSYSPPPVVVVPVVVATTTVAVATSSTQATTTVAVPAVIAPVVTKPISQMTIPELQAEIVRITGLINQLIAMLGTAGNSGIQPPGLIISRVTKVLKLASAGDEVRLLQTWLSRDSSVYPGGKITGYFGALTKIAVIKFQEKYASEILTPNGLSKGTGMVGASTRAKLNSLFGQ